jgi:subtilisin family serine protease
VLDQVQGVSDRALTDTADLTDLNRLADLRLERLRALVRANPRSLDVDDHGAPVVRGEVLAVSPSPASLAIAAKAGFSIARRTTLEGLDVEVVVLSAPAGVPAREALKRLRALDPQGRYDLDHIYSGAGETGGAARNDGAPKGQADARGVRVGLLDTGVDAAHPVFAGETIEQRSFAPGGVKAGEHGTAVASLMVGRAAGFHGAAPGAGLLAADVFGTGPTGGSAEAIARALGWMAQNHIAVINVSLVGPPNLTLEAAVRAVIAKGVLVVAPVGNDGPSARPLYPASYPGVIAVTGVDARGRILFEAGRASHVDFAAQGADVRAAKPGGGFETARGTSFAAPVVAGRLALLLARPSPAEAVAAVARLGAGIAPQDRQNTDGILGRGVVRIPAQSGH